MTNPILFQPHLRFSQPYMWFSRFILKTEISALSTLEKTLAARENASLPPRAKICISKNKALIWNTDIYFINTYSVNSNNIQAN